MFLFFRLQDFIQKHLIVGIQFCNSHFFPLCETNFRESIEVSGPSYYEILYIEVNISLALVVNLGYQL